MLVKTVFNVCRLACILGATNPNKEVREIGLPQFRGTSGQQINWDLLGIPIGICCPEETGSEGDKSQPGSEGDWSPSLPRNVAPDLNGAPQLG